MSMKLSDRIKEFYEDRTKTFLPRKTITIIRLDGKGFSKFTKGLNKPFDDGFSDDMDETTKFLCENIQGAKFGYTQSDEITIVLTDFDNLDTSAWYDYNIQKMTSISASLATAKFNQLRLIRACNNCDGDLREKMLSDTEINNVSLAMFDSRVFQVPTIDEMVNVLIWRQQDCTRNSISMAASANFSHKLLEGVSGDKKQDMLFTEKGINWNEYAVKYKRGVVVKKSTIDFGVENGKPMLRTKWLPDYETPIFTQDKDYLQNLIPTSK